MEIIRCDNEDMVRKVPNISSKLEKYFGDLDILLFVCINDENKIGFVGRRGNYCLYLDDQRQLPFGIKENNKINFYNKGDYNVFPYGYEEVDGDQPCCRSKDGIMHSVISYPMEFDEYCNGAISYFQYSKDLDVLCEIRYRHFYNEKDGKSPIYGYYQNKKIESVYIDKEYSKNDISKRGFMTKNNHHYELISFSDGMIGYKMIAISEYGLYDVLMNGSYNLLKDDTVNRYIKTFYVTEEGRPLEMMWPFCKFIKEEDILKEIESYGFGVKVPELLIDLYNGKDKDVILIEDLIKLMDKVIKENDNTKFMLLRKKIG